MSSPPLKKRTSILKKRISNFGSPEATATLTSKLPRRGILFSQKNSVKEFIQCDEKTTIWGNSYETSIAKSEGSSDGSSTSKKLSFDFSNSNIQVSSASTTTFESEKENVVQFTQEKSTEKENLTVPHNGSVEPGIEPIRMTLSPISTSTSNSGFSLENMTVDYNTDEKKRIKKYGTDNLNITNMQLDTTLSKKDVAKLVRSPRKTIFFHEDANMSVSLQENILSEVKESAENSLVLSLNLSLDEACFVKSDRKTTYKEKFMETSINQKPLEKVKEKIFKQPGIPSLCVPRVFSFSGSSLDYSNMNVESPPIKPVQFQNQKQVVDDFMEMMVTETPTKNLCSSMCITKKHSITPLSMPPPKILFSSSKTNWNVRTNQTDVLKNLGLNLDAAPDGSKNDSEMSIEVPATSKVFTRRSLFDSDAPTSSEEKTFFDLEDETVNATKSMTLVKLQDIEQPSEEDKEKTLHNEGSFNCNISDFNGKISGNSSYNRTNANETDVSESTFELAAKTARLLKDPMATIASPSDIYSKTYLQEANMDLDDSLAKTIRDESLNMSAEYERQLNVNKNKSSSLLKETIYNLSMSRRPGSSLRSQNLRTNTPNKTTNRRSIGISTIEPSVDTQVKNRLTVYEDSIEVDNHIRSPPKPEKKKFKDSRKTILDVSTVMDTSQFTFDTQQSKNVRLTVHENRSITETSVIQNFVPIEQKSTRGTIFVNESIDETHSMYDGASMNMDIQVPKSRCTVYSNDSIIETENIDDLHLQHKQSENDSIQDERNLGLESILIDKSDVSDKSASVHFPSQPRKTCYDDQMEETFNHFDVIETRDNAINHSRINFDVSQQFFSVEDAESPSNLSKNDIKIFQQKHEHSQLLENVSMPTEEPQEVAEPKIDFEEVTDNTEAMFRKTVIVAAPSKNVTFIKNVEVELETPKSEFSSINTAENLRKFRADENKLLNITSAEIVSLIDDETTLCFQDESVRSDIPPMRVSFGSNLSNYQQALQDFVNVTISNSPLNKSTVDICSVKQKFAPHKLPEKIDFTAKLNDLVINLEQKNDKMKPKFAIDEFLEKLKVKPIQIPKCPEIEAGYLMAKLRETNERLKREGEQRKASIALQLPETPDYGFLIDNKMKWMNEEIEVELKRKQRESLIAMTPVFPELRDFDFLLTNKFNTDEHLCKFWQLDLLFAWLRQYKFVHKSLPGYKINITVQQKTETLNRSTIPVYFVKVLMYENPKYRGIKSARTTKLMEEFRRSIGTDQFTSMCPSDKELFTFLQYFHEKVKKTVCLVDTFFDIIGKHAAILETIREGESLMISHISKRICTAEGDDIVDVMINVQGYIEEVNIDDVMIKGHTRYLYKLQPRPNIIDVKGLFLIELILFETSRFLLENTCRIQTE